MSRIANKRTRTTQAAPVACAVVCVVSIAVFLASSAAGPALAGDPHYDDAKQYGAVSVHDRDRTEFHPDGIRIGNYVMLPELGYNLTFNDNIFAAPKKTATSDFRHALATSVAFTSDLPRHMLDFMFSGTAVRLQQHDYFQYADFTGSTRFRIDIDHAHKIFGNATIERGHEDHAESETPANARTAIEVVRTRAEAGILRDAGQVSASVGARYFAWDYKSVESFAGNLIDQNYRDVALLSPFVKLNYRPSPGYKILGEFYSHLQTAHVGYTPNHTGRGLEARAGAEFEINPLVKLALIGGWETMSYDDQALIAVSRPVWEARLQWLISPVLTATARTERNLLPTSFGFASARLQSRYVIGAEYEMWRNLVLSSEAEFRKDEFVGSARVDNNIFARLGAEYTHTKNWLFNATYEYSHRSSTDSGDPATVNKIMLGAKYRY